MTDQPNSEHAQLDDACVPFFEELAILKASGHVNHYAMALVTPSGATALSYCCPTSAINYLRPALLAHTDDPEVAVRMLHTLLSQADSGVGVKAVTTDELLEMFRQDVPRDGYDGSANEDGNDQPNETGWYV